MTEIERVTNQITVLEYEIQQATAALDSLTRRIHEKRARLENLEKAAGSLGRVGNE